MTVILGVLVVTVVASLLSPKGKAQTAVAAARRHASEFVHVETDPLYCDLIFNRLLAEEHARLPVAPPAAEAPAAGGVPIPEGAEVYQENK